jgi:glycosyltransferase involved in cell wall biosynthesis
MYTLSYVLTTFNKLEFLRVTLPYLLEHCGEDEEIVIADGGSTDGTAAYLNDLLTKGRIHQFISEKDLGEAHGFNKAMLMARGKIIKVITDDDAFDHSAIQDCKTYFLDNPELDVIATNGVGKVGSKFVPFDFTNSYKLWLRDSKPFAFTGLGLFIRKSSIANIGLFNTSFVRVDAEYSLRISSGRCNFAWYTGYCWAHISNNGSNSRKYESAMKSELKRLYVLHGVKDDVIQNTKAKVVRILKPIKQAFKKSSPADETQTVEFQSEFQQALESLKHANDGQEHTILTRSL